MACKKRCSESRIVNRLLLCLLETDYDCCNSDFTFPPMDEFRTPWAADSGQQILGSNQANILVDRAVFRVPLNVSFKVYQQVDLGGTRKVTFRYEFE